MFLTSVVCLVAMSFYTNFRGIAQTITLTPESQAGSILNQLTPEERVGQLFFVTFTGTEISSDTQIYDLITNYHVGSIAILAEKDNLTYIRQSPDDTALQLRALTRKLQQTEWAASQLPQEDATTGESFIPTYIPLFIGLSQEGDGYPYDQVLSGLTALPNNMALGATWNPELAFEVGTILGSELASVGVNLLLGPSLDVLDKPNLEGGNDLGTRTFGGDPYWVGEMGSEYIRGIHQGGEGRVVTVAKHFPGHGSADRLPEDEVATVRKSLEELVSFDLAPFFRVTGNATSPEDTVDALLSSHIRYQGLQGNIRATTRPVSLDPQALNLLMELPELQAWRQNGGIILSDNLSSNAIQRFYNLTNQEFDIRRVSLNALLAGNDILYITDFITEDENDPHSAAVETIEFFAQKYREDNAFAQRVDESVTRILDAKLKLYDDFSLPQVQNILPIPSELTQANQTVFEVARQGATLISPTQTELDDTIPDPPDENDRIVFMIDTRMAKQCSQCAEQPLLDTRSLQDFVIRRYGPQAGGQVSPGNLSSYSLSNLQEMLDSDVHDLPVEIDLKRANWIVFALLNHSEQYPAYDTLIQFLNERPDLYQQKRIITFALNAPYYLDTTNISKITAYYGLYSKTSQFIDMASYLLFREIQPSGASPVSIPGINYDLNNALFPDPDQIIPLELDLPQDETHEGTTTPEPLPPPEFSIDDVIPVRTGVILDHNGNHVPDGTPVDFVLTLVGESSSARQTETTFDGIARTSFTVYAPGTLEVYAESETARSNILKFDIPSLNGNSTPTQEIETDQPTPSTVIQQIFVRPTPLATKPNPISIRTKLSDWIIAILLALGISWSTYKLAMLIGHIRWGIRAGFMALIGGLLGYSMLTIQLNHNQTFLGWSTAQSVIVITLLGTIVGIIIALTWHAISDRISRKTLSE